MRQFQRREKTIKNNPGGGYFFVRREGRRCSGARPERGEAGSISGIGEKILFVLFVVADSLVVGGGDSEGVGGDRGTEGINDSNSYRPLFSGKFFVVQEGVFRDSTRGGKGAGGGGDSVGSADYAGALDGDRDVVTGARDGDGRRVIRTIVFRFTIVALGNVPDVRFGHGVGVFCYVNSDNIFGLCAGSGKLFCVFVKVQGFLGNARSL